MGSQRVEVIEVVCGSSFDRRCLWRRSHRQASEETEDISVLIHGDDFVATGSREDINQFRQEIAVRFTVKDNIVGSRSDLGELHETRVLNRIIRWTQKGWEYEADQRHAELIVREMGMESAKSVKTPGEDVPAWKLDTEEEYLEGAQATKFEESWPGLTISQQIEWTSNTQSRNAAEEWQILRKAYEFA